VLARGGGGAEAFSRLISEVDELSRLDAQLKRLQLPTLGESGAALLERAVARATELLSGGLLEDGQASDRHPTEDG